MHEHCGRVTGGDFDSVVVVGGRCDSRSGVCDHGDEVGCDSGAGREHPDVLGNLRIDPGTMFGIVRGVAWIHAAPHLDCVRGWCSSLDNEFRFFDPSSSSSPLDDLLARPPPAGGGG